MISAVIDTSVAIEVAAGRMNDHGFERARLYAPHLIDVEFAQTMRALLLRGEISEVAATDAVTLWAQGGVIRCEHASLLPRVWQLRDNITAYDACFVALAERLKVPLITADRRLAAAAAEHCEVVLVA